MRTPVERIITASTVTMILSIFPPAIASATLLSTLSVPIIDEVGSTANVRSMRGAFRKRVRSCRFRKTKGYDEGRRSVVI